MALTAGCTYPNNPFSYDIPSSPSMDAYITETVRVNHDMVFLPGSASLDPIARAGLRSFVSQLGVETSDDITVVASGPFALARENEVAAELADLGISSVRMAEGNVGFDQVTVSLTRTNYLPTNCLDSGVEHVNPGVMQMPAGCSTGLNLARMVANPDDLLVGRPAGSTDGVTAARAVNRYRAGDTETLRIEATN
ncbi:MAG: hypothetical protein HKM95_13880 [Inquilinus sp.]|nr:hypothetical protein [Inquilinus sp.]